MAKNKTIHVKGTEITVLLHNEADYISLTDIARFKDADNTDTIIQNWLRNRNTVESTGTAANLVHQDEAPLGDIVEDGSRLVHFHHEGRLARRDIVGSPYPSEHFIDDTQLGRTCGHKTSHLGHQRNQGRLAQQSRFTRHVGTSNHHNLLLLVV